MGPILSTPEFICVESAGHFVTIGVPDRRTDQVVYMNMRGPSRSEAPRGSDVDKWGIHFAPPVIRGDVNAKTHA
eukprot:782159-Pyramimonas_sp.AAC.1